MFMCCFPTHTTIATAFPTVETTSLPADFQTTATPVADGPEEDRDTQNLLAQLDDDTALTQLMDGFDLSVSKDEVRRPLQGCAWRWLGLIC